MVVAGLYVAYYGWYEWRVLEHNDTSGGGDLRAGAGASRCGCST